VKETNVLLVGFGFSAIPLLRELDLSGVDYTIISESDGSIWAKLERSSGLDFDLVSSYYTTFYTFDLVEDFGEDRYPTAREYYDMHLRYQRKYKDRITHDFVTWIEDKGDHRLVHTKKGEVYKANHVVISTAFRRKVHDSLHNFDFSVRDKTIVFDTIGDSANLMMAKLVAGDNKIICLQNGFLALDKLFYMGDTSFSLDQLEGHQMARSFPRLYDAVIHFNFVRLIKILPRPKVPALYFRAARKLQSLFGKLFTPENFHVPFERTRRGYEGERPIQSQIPNGAIAIKYWPIDTYHRKFSDKLAQHIRDGYLLNDIVYFVSEGIIKLWDKDRTQLNEVRKIIECDGQSVKYDYLIQGDAERPNLPRITHLQAGETVDYDYVYRDVLFGVSPKQLNNIYLLGYTRPLTGGLKNITETQSLFIHRMITDQAFHDHEVAHLESRLERYNKRYYPSASPTPRDHTTYYGFYTQEVAEELGIALSLKDCKSARDVMKYLCYPNNIDKFRQRGRYKIDKCEAFVDHVFTQHKGFKFVWQLHLSYAAYQMLVLAIAGSLWYHGWIGALAFGGVALFQAVLGYWAMIPVANSMPYFGTKLGLFAAYLPMLLDPRTALAILPLDFAVTFVLRQLPAARYPFNDLKNKKRYRAFYEHYKQVYNEVRGRAPRFSPAEVTPAASTGTTH
jgi:hypothetical protein